MGFPKIEAIKAYIDICQKDGIGNIIDEFISKEMRPEYKPIMMYLKTMIETILEEPNSEYADFYTSGFMTCFDIFRRQIESEEATLEDLEMQLQNMLGWISYLENENLEIKNELRKLQDEIKRLSEILPEVPTIQ